MKVDFEEKNQKQLIENYRRRIRINQDFNTASGCIHRVADKKGELEAAYNLVHESFVKRGYSNAQASGIRVSIWNAVPGCTTVISTNNSKVLGTATLYPDSDLGLPMDRVFVDELQPYRQGGERIIEIGSLASIIPNQMLVFQLYKFLLLYSEEYMEADAIVISVHPKRTMFYKAVFDFKQFGPVKNYPAVNNKPAVPLMIRLRDLHTSVYDEDASSSMSRPFYKNIYHAECRYLQFPEKSNTYGSWNADLFYYFLYERTKLFQKLDENMLLNLQNYYENRETFTKDLSASFSNQQIDNPAPTPGNPLK